LVAVSPDLALWSESPQSCGVARIWPFLHPTPNPTSAGYLPPWPKARTAAVYRHWRAASGSLSKNIHVAGGALRLCRPARQPTCREDPRADFARHCRGLAGRGMECRAGRQPPICRQNGCLCETRLDRPSGLRSANVIAFRKPRPLPRRLSLAPALQALGSERYGSANGRERRPDHSDDGGARPRRGDPAGQAQIVALRSYSSN
jgi:hypothetical protein